MDINELFARPEESPDRSPEERIITATLDCIAASGLEGATVRSIATLAGLNPGAVNYYYRSKERLVELALRQAWSHVSEDIDRIMAETTDQGRVADIATRFLLEGACRYPRIIRAVLVEHPGLRLEAAAYFRGLYARLAAASGRDVDESLGATLLVAFASFLGTGQDAVGLMTGLDLAKPADRDRLSAGLAALLFGPPPAP